MWVLNRITWPYQALRCHATNKTLSYGDYFYYDTESGHVIDEEFYNRMKWKKIKEDHMPNVNKASTEVMYRQMLIQSTADYLQRNILEIDRLQEHMNEGMQYNTIHLPDPDIPASYDIKPFGKEVDMNAEDFNIWD